MAAGWTCQCGANNAAAQRFCENCGTSRGGSQPTASGAPAKTCSKCGEGFQFWTSLTLGDDGQRRCATCHVARLKLFVSRPADRCSVPGCDKSVAEHIAEFRAVGARVIQHRVVQTERSPDGGVQL